MPNIIAAQFDDFPHAEAALRDLAKSSTLSTTDVDHVVLGAPGRHDRYPIGGDQGADTGAVDGDKGAVSGAAIGTVVGAASGLAATAVLGPLGAAATAAVAAYGGSLAGALGSMGERDKAVVPPPRPAGVMVMVHAPSWASRAVALNAFERNGARSIEEADGQWSEGTWADFNPVSTPRWLVPPSTSTPSLPEDRAADDAKPK